MSENSAFVPQAGADELIGLSHGPKFQSIKLGAVGKVVVDGLPNQFLRVPRWPLLQVDTQLQTRAGRELPRPAHNELFRLIIEIFSMNGEVSMELKS